MKASKRDILRRIGGLNYAGSRAEENAPPIESSSNEPSMNRAYRMMARLVAIAMGRLGLDKTTLFDLLEPMSSTAEELLPVVRWMAEEGYCEVLERPRNGNWTILLTASGVALRQPR